MEERISFKKGVFHNWDRERRREREREREKERERVRNADELKIALKWINDSMKEDSRAKMW